MRNLFLKVYLKVQALKEVLIEENGQDIVEYAIVMTLIALGATAAMKTLATTIAAGYVSVNAMLTTYTT